MSHGNASLTPTGRLRLARCVADAELACSGCRSRRASAVGGVPYEVYLQLLEEIAQRWLTPALAMSVHTLSCTPLLQHRGDGVLALLPDLLGGERLGAFCLSEPQAGSDVAAMPAGSASPRARSASLKPRSTSPSTTPAASSAGR